MAILRSFAIFTTNRISELLHISRKSLSNKKETILRNTDIFPKFIVYALSCNVLLRLYSQLRNVLIGLFLTAATLGLDSKKGNVLGASNTLTELTILST